MATDLFEELGIDPHTPIDNQDVLAGIPGANEKPPRYENAGFFKKLPANILAGLGDLKQNVLNQSKREWDLVSPFVSQIIPEAKHVDYSKELGLPGTASDRLIQGLVSNAPLLTPFGAEGAVAKGISYIPKIGEALAGPAERIASQGLIGAATGEGEDPFKSGTSSAMVQAALEALPAPFKLGGKAIKKYAEAINPIEFATQKANQIRDAFGKAKVAEKEAFESFNEIAHNEFKNPENYSQAFKKYNKYITPEIQELHEAFTANPTLQTAHNLKSKMFQDYLALSHDPANIDRVQGIKKMREALRKDLLGEIENLNPEVAKKYKQGEKITAREVEPYLSTEGLRHLVKGEFQDVDPSRLQNILKEAAEKKHGYKSVYDPDKYEDFIPKGHFIRDVLNNVNSKMNKAEMSQLAIPYIKKITGLAQNPEVEKVLSKWLPRIERGVGITARGIFD